MPEDEAAVALTARSLGERVDGVLEIADLLTARDARQREVRAIERSIARAPARRSTERGRRLRVTLREKERPAERPQVERTARSWTASSCRAEVGKRSVEIAARQRGPRRVLVQHIGKDIELERLQRDRVRLAELTPFVEREIELSQQHRVGRAIESRPRRETASGVHAPRAGASRGHRFAKVIFRTARRLFGWHEQSVALTVFSGQTRRARPNGVGEQVGGRR